MCLNSSQSEDEPFNLKRLEDSVERYKFTVSYNGTHYSGFQTQGSRRTVQRELELSLRKLGWKETRITAAGRTDTGVHAEGQVFSAELSWKHGLEALIHAINANLPDDIAVKSAEIVPSLFHARFDAKNRCYHYHVYHSSTRDPLRDIFCWRVWPDVNLESLNEAAGLMIGTFDFRAFGSPPRKDRGTIRTVLESYWVEKEPDEKVYCIRANAFLYHMVRRIVFVQIAYARGKISKTEIQKALAECLKLKPGLALPNGLRLFEVVY